MFMASIRLRRKLTCWFHDVVLIELDASSNTATSADPQVDGQPATGRTGLVGASVTFFSSAHSVADSFVFTAVTACANAENDAIWIGASVTNEPTSVLATPSPMSSAITAYPFAFRASAAT